VLAAVLLPAGCGGGHGSPASATTTQAQELHASAEEVRWAAEVDGFAARLVPDLRRLERLTGGGAKIGAFGRRLDRRIFVPGPQRRQFEAAMTTLAACGPTLSATVPRAPTARLRTVRATLVQACTQLERVPELLRHAVLRARTPGGLDPGVLSEAAGRGDEGVHGVVDALSTMRRVLRSQP
jgi:hypothetical protein